MSFVGHTRGDEGPMVLGACASARLSRIDLCLLTDGTKANRMHELLSVNRRGRPQSTGNHGRLDSKAWTKKMLVKWG